MTPSNLCGQGSALSRFTSGLRAKKCRMPSTHFHQCTPFKWRHPPLQGTHHHGTLRSWRKHWMGGLPTTHTSGRNHSSQCMPQRTTSPRPHSVRLFFPQLSEGLRRFLLAYSLRVLPLR